MKKAIFGSLFLFLLACNNKPSETNDSSMSNTVPDSSDAFIRKWSEKIANEPFGDTINFTDAANLKQGHWIIFENGKKVKEEWYRDGKLIDKPESK